ncbi:hypothetical protein NDI52_27520 [Leptolyngbya sp. PL-A3]|uniref:hypothetical protein n=1 Tax=Leptolyngbya sp. PL-A3 TaxID=2933911 RepID=UPI0032996030
MPTFDSYHQGFVGRDKLIPTTRKNPCVLCGNTSGKCREANDLRLCMEYTTSSLAIPGYRFTGLSKDGLWGVWVVDDGASYSKEDREQWWQEQQIRRHLREQAEAAQRAQSLPAVERDRHYQRLLSHLTLHPEDRADLHRRGLSEAHIKAGGFVSVEQWQKLPEDFPLTLPGVNLDGRSLNVSGPGYLCPIRDIDGLIVGLQLRLRDVKDSGRYRWLSSVTHNRPNGQPPNLPNGELPLAVFRPEVTTRQAIALVEGTGPKPFITSQRLGVITVGAAGGLFAASSETLRVTLGRLATELGTRRIEFFPDAGSLENPHVLRQYWATWELLEQQGYLVHVGWWGQVSKAHPDIDELEDVEAIAFLSPHTFLAMAPADVAATVAAHIQQADAAKVEARLSQEQVRERYRVETDRLMAECNGLRVEPTLTLSGRYIPSGLLQLPQTAGTVVIDGPMGVGKTSTALKELVEQHRRQYPTAFRCLLTPRNALGRQSAAVLGLPHHTAFKGFGPCPTEVTLCPESGWRFPTKRLPDGPPLILIDEVSQLLHQVLEGKTSGQNHALNLHWLRSLLQWVNAQGGWIVLSEDGITNLEIDLIAQASGLEVIEFFKFERTDSERRDMTLFSSPSLTWAEIKNRLNKGENLVIASDSATWLRHTREMAIAKASTFAQLDTSEITLTEARSILEELEASQEQREVAHKRLLQDKLPGVNLNDPHFILKALVENNGRFLKTAELLWMARNPKAAQWLDRWTWINEFTQATRRGQFASYTRLSFRSGQAKLLSECPLQPFIDGTIEQWDNNSWEAIAVHQWAVLHRHQFRRYLRLTIAEDHPPVKTVNKLLRKLGYEVKHQGWKGNREQRERQYGITNLEDADREAILKALEERFIQRLKEKEGIAETEDAVPVIATCIEIPLLPSCDHGPQPDWSHCPQDVLEIMQAAWLDAENTQQRQVVLDAIAEYGRAIAS